MVSGLGILVFQRSEYAEINTKCLCFQLKKEGKNKDKESKINDEELFCGFKGLAWSQAYDVQYKITFWNCFPSLLFSSKLI